MRGKDTETLPTKLFSAYKKHLNQVETWKAKEPGVELIYIDYKDALEDTEDTVKKVVSFIGKDMNEKEMQLCVDKTLYRNKI